MENNLEIFKNEMFGQIRTIMIKDRPYFVGNDIAEALGYARPRKAIQDHCKGDVNKVEIKTNGGIQTMTVIDELSLHMLLSNCKSVSLDYRKKCLNGLQIKIIMI